MKLTLLALLLAPYLAHANPVAGQAVAVERADGTLVIGELLLVTDTELTVRIYDQRLLVVSRAEVVRVTPRRAAVAPPAPTVQPDEPQRRTALVAANLDARAISEDRCATPLLWVGGIAALVGGCGVAVSLWMVWANPVLGGGCLVGSLCVAAVGVGVATTGLQSQQRADSLRNDAAVLRAMNY